MILGWSRIHGRKMIPQYINENHDDELSSALQHIDFRKIAASHRNTHLGKGEEIVSVVRGKGSGCTKWDGNRLTYHEHAHYQLSKLQL
jgi:hypothetical protein